jgi:ABC-type multidrug transport system ATPase subunit
MLKALMQLFAIIARPQSGMSDRSKVIEAFLRKQLNRELALEYFQIFDNYYNQYQAKYKDTEKHQKHTSSSSVKLLVICSQINKELTQIQKLTLMVLLLSFIKSGHGKYSTISEFEQEFVETVATAFNIDTDEFQELLQFVMLPASYIPLSANLLFVDNRKEGVLADAKHLFREGLSDSLIILHVKSVNAYIGRYEGNKELYLNSQIMSIDDIYMLNYGCNIRNPQIKPVYYSDIINCFYLGTQASPILFEAKDVTYKFDNGATGLHPVNFEILSGNLVGIMGGSGAGKSTLLSVFTGLYQPSAGQVLLNNMNIHTQSQEIEGLIGYVSQDDLLVEELTVYQNLYFNAKLCFGQYPEEEICRKTEDMLHGLGLYEIRNMKVGSPLNKKISGGQRKRLNIALEMIRQPAVLFLDEPTSGLSSRDSDNIMNLLKELSLKGKLVFTVIHQPSSDIFKMFDRLLVLDQGGYLIYNGNPVDAVLYFKSQTQQANRNTSECAECGNVNPEQVFNIVESRVLNEHGHITNTRRISPKEWYDRFNRMPRPQVPENERPDELPPGTVQRPSRLKQFTVYATRNILTKLSDLQYIIVCLLEAPLLALILSYVIRYYNVSDGAYTFELNENLPIYIFVAVIIAIFVGLSISAEEIIRDRKIIKREAFLNLSRGSYLFSKTLVLFIISAIQSGLFVWVGNSVTGVLDMHVTYWAVIFSAWACANLMGLIISDTFKSVVTIYILIPFIVIPQLMLSGVLLRFEKINPDISSPASVPWYGEMITARWAFEALAVEQFMNNHYERIVYPYEKTMSTAEFRKNYWLVEMKNKLNGLKLSVEQGQVPDSSVLQLMCNEIDLENKQQDVVTFAFRERLASENLSGQLIDDTDQYFGQLTRYYTMLYNRAAERKDRQTMEIAAEDADRLHFLKSHCHNQSLSDMVKNSNETYRLIEYRGRLLQNYHPVYKDPEHPFIKAQFYAPEKRLFGARYPTLWVNIMVMWCFNVFFFVALYFRWLPNLLKLFQKWKR